MNIDLEVQYLNDIHMQYLIITADDKKLEGYQLKMILNNKIAGLLKLELRMINNIPLFYYDINSKVTFHHILMQRPLKYDELYTILSGILNVIDHTNEFFLLEDNFLIDLNYIYVNPDNLEVNLCYFIGYTKSLLEQLTRMVEIVMNQVNHKNERVVLLIYGLYKICRESGCSFQKVQSYIKDNGKLAAEDHFLKENDPELRLEEENCGSGSDNLFHKTEDLLVNHDTLNKPKIPIPMPEEKIEQEEEIMVYSRATLCLVFISALLVILVSAIVINSKILYNTFRTSLDIKKIILYFMIASATEAYILYQLLQKKNKISKIITKIEYVDNNKFHRSAVSSHQDPYKAYQSSDAGYKKSNVDPSILEMPRGEDRSTISNYDKSSEYNMELTKADSFSTNNQTEVLYDIAKSTEVLYSKIDDSKVVLEAKNEYNPEEYENIAIVEFPFFIGKLKSKKIYIIDHNAVSRYHARIDYTDKSYYITDLNSTNGTYVNMKRIEPNISTLIQINDEITIAHIRYRLSNLS